MNLTHTRASRSSPRYGDSVRVVTNFFGFVSLNREVAIVMLKRASSLADLSDDPAPLPAHSSRIPRRPQGRGGVKITMVGLGRMGPNMTEWLRRSGHAVGYDRNPDKADVASVEEAVAVLAGETRRVVWVMVPAGAPTSATVDQLRPVFDALVTERGFAHVGPVGAGHYTKMVHNGVEYALAQAYAEGYELAAAAVEVDVQAMLKVWRHSSVVRSWLLDLLVDGLVKDPSFASVSGYVEDSGEGRWTVEEAVRTAVSAPAIAAAFARFSSRQDDSPAMKAIATLHNQFGGHAVRTS